MNKTVQALAIESRYYRARGIRIKANIAPVFAVTKETLSNQEHTKNLINKSPPPHIRTR